MYREVYIACDHPRITVCLVFIPVVIFLRRITMAEKKGLKGRSTKISPWEMRIKAHLCADDMCLTQETQETTVSEFHRLYGETVVDEVNDALGSSVQT